MTHYHARPASECPGRLEYLESFTRSEQHRERRVDELHSQYQCDGCGEYVTLRRHVLDAPEGTNVPVVELRWEL